MSLYRLEAEFNGATTREDTRFTYTFYNGSAQPLTGVRVGFWSMTRMADEAVVFVRRHVFLSPMPLPPSVDR